MTDRNPNEVVIPRQLALTLLMLLGAEYEAHASVQEFKQLVHKGWDYEIDCVENDGKRMWALHRRPQHGEPLAEWVADFQEQSLALMVKATLEAERDRPKVMPDIAEVTMPRKVAAEMRDLALDMGALILASDRGVDNPAYVVDGRSLRERRFQEFVKYI